MRILVVGAGQVGTRVLRQLQKNPALTILVADAREAPEAVRAGIIERVDFSETLTPLTLRYLLDQAKPDLVLLTTSSEDLALGKSPGMDILTESLRKEVAAMSPLPVIQVARGGG
jgi:ketopantoate reductase